MHDDSFSSSKEETKVELTNTVLNAGEVKQETFSFKIILIFIVLNQEETTSTDKINVITRIRRFNTR